MLDQMAEQYAEELAVGGVVVGVTDRDMYSREKQEWRYVVGLRSRRAPMALVSRARMQRVLVPPLHDDVATVRLTKMVTRELALLYCGERLNGNTRSILFNNVLG